VSDASPLLEEEDSTPPPPRSLDGRRISEDPLVEIGCMAYLSSTSHGNVLKMFAVYEDEHNVYMELECLSGGDLFEAVQHSPGGRFSEERARKTMLQLLQGLCFMHGRGIIHRDLSLGSWCVGRCLRGSPPRCGRRECHDLGAGEFWAWGGEDH
jgi:serine/threonine protein kinase